jgi:hypothetical protein
VIAYSRPFLPLFLHVLGAMTLFGAVLTAALLAWVAWRKDAAVLRRGAFRALLFVAVPAWIVTSAGGHMIASKEGFNGKGDPRWLKIGTDILEPGVVVLLITIGAAFWWQRSGKPLAGRIVAVLASVYLLMLAVAWLAMSGKWG